MIYHFYFSIVLDDFTNNLANNDSARGTREFARHTQNILVWLTFRMANHVTLGSGLDQHDQN